MHLKNEGLSLLIECCNLRFLYIDMRKVNMACDATHYNQRTNGPTLNDKVQTP